MSGYRPGERRDRSPPGYGYVAGAGVAAPGAYYGVPMPPPQQQQQYFAQPPVVVAARQDFKAPPPRRPLVPSAVPVQGGYVGGVGSQFAGGMYAPQQHYYQPYQAPPPRQYAFPVASFDVASAAQQQEGDVVVGVSNALERDYTRDEPKREQLRPLAVLQRAFEHVIQKGTDPAQHGGSRLEGLAFLMRQLKGIRQDIKSQRIENTFAARVHEAHGRLALQMGDMSEFLTCQTALSHLYGRAWQTGEQLGFAGDGGLAVEEFYAYRLLQLATAQKRQELLHQVQELTVASERTLSAAAELAPLRDKQNGEFIERIARPVAQSVQAAGGRVRAPSGIPSIEQMVLHKGTWEREARLLRIPPLSEAKVPLVVGCAVLSQSEVDRILRSDECAAPQLPASAAAATEAAAAGNKSAFGASVALMRRPAIVALLAAIALLERDDGHGFCSAIVDIAQQHEHLRSGILCMVQYTINRLRTRWLLNLTRGLKGTQQVPVRLVAGALGFLSGIDAAMHDAVTSAIGGMWSWLHYDHQGTGQAQQQQQPQHHHGADAAAGADEYAARNWHSYFAEAKFTACPPLRPLAGVKIDFAALQTACEEYVTYLTTGSLKTPTVAAGGGGSDI